MKTIVKKLVLLCSVALLAAACTPSGSLSINRYGRTDAPGGGNGSTSPSSGTDQGSQGGKLSDALQGWRCISYNGDAKIFDQTLAFHYDENGHVDYYDERLVSYKGDGVTVASDDNYKRIYHYTTPTHIDYYNDYIEGHSPATWYEFDDKGRITEAYNHYGDNHLYHYNADGQLIEIENSFQYEDSDDEELYGSWKKSRIIVWETYNGFKNLASFYQKWTSGSKVVTRTRYFVQLELKYLNPFRNMVIDPTVLGTGVFQMLGWCGAKSDLLVYDWYSEDTPQINTIVNLITDSNNRVTGMVTQDRNYSLGTRREYTFTWKGEAPVLEESGIQIIN